MYLYMCLVYIFSSTKTDINGMLRLPGEIIRRREVMNVQSQARSCLLQEK